jgi:protein SCO1/2
MSNRYWISVGVIALVAALAGVYVGRLVSQPDLPALESGTPFPKPRILQPFALVDAHNAPTTPDTLRGGPKLVFFGFTHCPDVCPTTLPLLASVQKQANVPGLRVALISVDPERDTPEAMGSYVSSFGGDLIGLTGTAPEIVNATRAFGVAAARVELGGGNYTMDHSATVFALDSDARIVAVFTPPLRADALARDLAKLGPTLASAPGAGS